MAYAPAWDTACPDWELRLAQGRSLVPDLPLFPSERDKALRIFNRLKLPDVIGSPPMAEAAGDWFRDIVAALFGSYDAGAGKRMIQEVFLLVPKKNGKSSYAAAIMVVAMIMNRRPEAEFLLIAPTKEIADIAFRQAHGTIKADPSLLKLFHAQRHIRTITHRNSGATLKIKAADTDVITGSKSTGILVDETHVFAKKPNAKDIFVEVRGALAARPDGFMMQITTQSKEPPEGVFKSELAIARKVRDGTLHLPKARLAVLYELPLELAKDNGWQNEALWPRVNPNLGRSVDAEFLQNALVTALEGTEKDIALLASQHFNVEVGTALADDAWAGALFWADAADPELTLEELLKRCDVVVAGVDGGGLDDLLGLALLGRCRVTKQWLLWNRAWVHPIALERRKEIRVKLEELEAADQLVICTETGQDYRELVALLKQVQGAGLFPDENAVGLDPAGVSALVDQLKEADFTAEQLVAIPQGYKLSSAVWGMERKLSDGSFRHAGQELMTWCVGNAKVEQRGNAVLITKQAAGKAKIDPLAASFNAFQLMSRAPAIAQPELYI